MLLMRRRDHLTFSEAEMGRGLDWSNERKGVRESEMKREEEAR
jgi:hypothetical protein